MAGRLRPLIPDIAFRTGWSSSAFLLYAGAYVIAASVVSLAADLGSRSDVGDLKLVMVTGLLVILLATAANALRRTGNRVSAGLFAVIALVMFGIWVGVTENWLGLWPDDTESFVPSDFDVGIPLLATLLVAAGLAAIQLFRFPLLSCRRRLPPGTGSSTSSSAPSRGRRARTPTGWWPSSSGWRSSRRAPRWTA